MKLIDADEFAIDESKLWDWSSVDDISSTAVLKQCIWDVQCAPEVKAIPIEWIKNIINTNIYLWEQDKERMFVDQGVVKVVNYSITAQILSELIDRWEKENADKS